MYFLMLHLAATFSLFLAPHGPINQLLITVSLQHCSGEN
jgi:hypothetical protein